MTYDQTHWAPVQRRGPLPTFYYHEHFIEMLDFVAAHYAHTFLAEHAAFVQDFRKLSRPAQCLYVRLVNRKGRLFARSRLRYPELGDMAPLLDILRAGGWVGAPGAGHFEEMLGFLTRDDLYRVLLPRFAGLPRSMKKAQLVAFARENMPAPEFMIALDTDRVLVQGRSDEVSYLLFLYFGRIRNGLSQFTMRDLGLVRTQSRGDAYEPRFDDRAEALENFFYATRLHHLESFRVEDAGGWPEPNFSSSSRLRDELAYRAGRRLEKSGDVVNALCLYESGESAQCSERVVRLLLASDRRNDAQQYLEKCLDNPRSDEEWLVARDLYERKFRKKRTSDSTDLLRAGEVVEIDESRSGAPERAVIEHFENLGCEAYRSENLLWRTLFGLLFWDELFGNDEAAMSSPFDFVPASLANGRFYEHHAHAIQARLASLADTAAAKRAVLLTSTRHYGKANGVFRWRESMNAAVMALLEHAPPASIARILESMARDYEEHRYGYPDLLVIDGDGPRFVEVKTEGDQLRRNQVLRIRQLREAGFTADVVRVKWILDPAQNYVVVDVETTGGKGDNHRVTEIGAVKVRGGEIVDRFQTLLNPQRTIPANISRLTGISPAMVEDAPYFADVADRFEEFMGDAIFVAHNVDFDYGFISREYARLGRSFRHARLCTCSSMRRLYPGLRSYSLAALSRQFDISLQQHHRALCDAEAAAELLLLVNERRLGQQ
ncbi:MAG: exonuclease domain-containing protein [Woeseiaceae bacterium]|nr:exonuclease domain-containing protein [Woeseiaceae bacterium]